MLTPANTCGCSHSRRETPQRQSKGARWARCKPPRSARRRSAGSFGSGEGASEATPTGYHPRCPHRLGVCEEASRKLFPRILDPIARTKPKGGLILKLGDPDSCCPRHHRDSLAKTSGGPMGYGSIALTRSVRARVNVSAGWLRSALGEF